MRDDLLEIARNVIERAKKIREGLKTDLIGTVKNYKQLLDVPSLVIVKKTSGKSKEKTSEKTSKTKTVRKKAVRKTTSPRKPRVKKEIH